MATLAELKTRVITELNRDDMGAGGDLETVLNNAIDRAIEFHADELFWFNRLSGTTNTSGASSVASLPAGMRYPLEVSYLQEPLTRVPLDSIQYLTDTGIPTRWAENEGAIQLWPIPDGVYSLSVQGVAELGTPVTSNEWTTTAYDLIAARVRLILYRDIMRDAGGASMAAQAEAEALAKLRRESRKRRESPLRDDRFTVTRFNINRGW